jgi:hypothetical protein
VKNLPWRVIDQPESAWGLVIVDADDGVVAYFAYPDDEDRRTYSGARENAETICEAMNASLASVP